MSSLKFVVDMDLYDSLGMLNSAIQFAGAQVGAVDDKKWIAKENQKARDFQIEMWNKANEYNMPSAVLDRYAKAGISVNPNYLVTGKYDGGLASLASSPGHSAPNMGSKDLAKYGNLFGGFAQAQQLKLQKDLVDSQISLNESQEAKNIASAEESRSKIGANLSNKHLIDSLTGKNKLDIAFNELTFDVRNAIVNFDSALKEQGIQLIRSQIKNLDAATDNNNKLTDMRITSMAQSLEIAWKRLDLDAQQLAGQLEYWAKLGDASVLQSKANFLNSLTNSKAFNLEKDKFEKFSDEQLNLLKANIYKLKTFNGWYDSMLEMQYNQMQRNYNNSGKQGRNLDLQNSYFDMQLFMPLLDISNVKYF